MAYSHLRMEGAELWPSGKQLKDYFHEAQGIWLHHAWTVNDKDTLFVDDMMHVPTCDKLRNEILAIYPKDFEITGGGLMETFLGMEFEQPGKVIKLHLDSYIQEVLTEYKEYINT